MAVLKIPMTCNDHIQGDVNAPITLVEYGDYQCSFCAMAYPTSIEAAEFAAEQKLFWETHD